MTFALPGAIRSWRGCRGPYGPFYPETLMASASSVLGEIAKGLLRCWWAPPSSSGDRLIRSDASGSSSYVGCRRYYDDRMLTVALAEPGVFFACRWVSTLVAVGTVGSRRA